MPYKSIFTSALAFTILLFSSFQFMDLKASKKPKNAMLESSNITPELDLEMQYSGFEQIVKLAHANDQSDRLFVVEKTGRIKIIDSMGTTLPDNFLNLSNIVSTNSERGLLGLAFHPNYAANGFFYVYYSKLNGDSVIARYSVMSSDPNKADSLSELVLLDIEQPFANHNGGDIHFGPNDGYLYIASGDGGSGNDPGCEAQDTTNGLGKILRIDVDVPAGSIPPYAIPPSNPFAGEAGLDQSIWALGLRNPWRFSFDRENGDMWIADVGQDATEEVDYIAAPLTPGLNFGWKFMEGNNCINNNTTDPDCSNNTPPCFSSSYTDPIFEYGHNFVNGGFSITGGYVYRGCKYPPLYGKYICADYISANFWTMDNTGDFTLYDTNTSNVTTFGEDEDGELYCANILGQIFRVIESSIPSELTITTADLPLQGEYRAYDKIIIEGELSIADMETVHLLAPEILIQDKLTSETNENLIIEQWGCL